jgi:hypothetical protein
LHISHLVPLERSNFAYVLGSSGEASSMPNSFEENVCENANTLAHVIDHMVVLAHLRRRRSLSGREGLGPSLLPAELARRDSSVFEELKRLFPLRRKSEKKRKRTDTVTV